MTNIRRCLAVLLAVSAASCSLPEAVARLEDHAPAPELGRPGWVQGTARIGAYLGGVVGGLGAIVTFPVMKVLTLAAGDALGADDQDLLYAPVAIGAGAGHVVFGAPLDALSYLVVPGQRSPELALEEAVPPVGPGPAPETGEQLVVEITETEGADGS
jgi:hypothetical protein